MSKFPTNLDDDTTLPSVNDNITEIGELAINSAKDAILAIEGNIGIGAAGTTGSIAARLSVSFNPDGTPNASLLASMGLAPNSVYDFHVNPAAAIKESKLDLDFSTQDLHDMIIDDINKTQQSLDWISTTGSKLDPHLSGTQYRHKLVDIDVGIPSDYLKNKFAALRPSTSAYATINDINNELVGHQKLDGTSVAVSPHLTVTGNSGTTFSANYAHPATGIFLDVRNFTFIPQTANDVQKFADFVNASNINIIGTRVQSFYSNGISRTSRASSLIDDTLHFNSTVGQAVVPYTLAKTYLLESGTAPVDNIDTGDDIIEFIPSDGYLFDSQFALVNIGDIVTVNYENIDGNALVVSYVIKEKKTSTDLSGNRVFKVRTDNHNIYGSSYLATGRVDKPLFNINKYGVLALAQAQLPSTNNFGALPSLISGSPRGANALGMNFNPDLITATNYNLYLQFYPNGSPSSSINNLPAIDITGNAGTTPGKYTLDSIIEKMNAQFRAPGFNYRFTAYQNQGQLGVMLADSYNNASFAIICGILDPSTGSYSSSLSNTTYPNNVIDIFNVRDPLGFGPNNANLASPPFTSSFATSELAKTPTRILVPLKRNNYYVDGSESEKFVDGYLTTKDSFDNGYWEAIITNKTIVPGSHSSITYKVNLNLTAANLQIGKTLVVQPSSASAGSYIDFGRFVISDVQFVSDCINCNNLTTYTNITVYDGIHATGVSPFASAPLNTPVRIYFDDSSIGFNIENASDINALAGPFKRFFETYIDSNGHTFTHERARINISGSTQTINSSPSFNLYSDSFLSSIDFYNISPKLRGFQSGNYSKLTLLANYSDTTGVIDGYLCQFDGVNVSNIGPLAIGKKGEIVRFFDQTTVDYIDFIIDLDTAVPSFAAAKIDIQFYPTLSLDDELMMLGTCQVNTSDKSIKNLRDTRQFGNVSEKQLSSSALDYINVGNKVLHQNGVIKGLDVLSATNNAIVIRGGTALVNGNFVNINNTTLNVPLLQEVFSASTYTKINWLLCINHKGDFEFIPLTDLDTDNSGITTTQRIFTAKNPLTGGTYTIDSKTFAEIVNTRKDLVPLHKVSTFVNGSGVLTSTLLPSNIHDARKYSFESDAITFPVLTSEKSQGNFYSFDALATWINYNTTYFNDIGIKGNVSIASTYVLGGSNAVKLKGNNVSAVTFATGANVIFNNFEFNNLPVVIAAGSTVVFNNCTFNSGSFTVNASSTVTVNGCSFIKSTMVLNQSVILPAGTTITNSTVTVNSSKGIIINTDDVVIIGSNFTYNFDPTSDGIYNPSLNVNTQSGMISVANGSTFSRKNLTIRDNKFTTVNVNYYPLISMESNFSTDHYQGIDISNNKFINTFAADSTKAIIAFASNLTTATLEGARLVDMIIDNNTADKNQIIAIMAAKDGYGNVNNALSTISCQISKNTVGAILATNRYETARGYANTNGLVKDKLSSLLIKENNCKYIADGVYAGSSILVETGKIEISKNHIASINLNLATHTSLIEERRAELFVTNNSFTPVAPSTFGYNSGYAAIIQAAGAAGNPINFVFANNVFNFGTTVASDGVTKTINYYTQAYLATSIPVTLTDNIFKGIGNTTSAAITNSLIYLENGGIVTGNRIYRGAFNIDPAGSYISVVNGDCIVTDNMFDHPTLNGTVETLLTVVGSASLIYERNKNQTCSKYIPLYNIALSALGAGAYTTAPQTVSSQTYSIVRVHDTNKSPSNGATQINSSTTILDFWLPVTISEFLPNNVTVTQCRLGAYKLVGTITNAPYNALNQITLQYTVSNDNIIMDVKNQYDTVPVYNVNAIFPILNGTADSNISSNTQYVTTVPVSNNQLSNTNSTIVSILCFIEFDTDGSLQLSPLEIKYRW